MQTTSPVGHESLDHKPGRNRRAAAPFLFGLDGIDLGARRVDRSGIERFIPHRGRMSLLDAIVWTDDSFRRGIAVRHVRADEEWVAGHFPGIPILPGVLMVEMAAQLACYLYNASSSETKLGVLLRVDETTFRSAVRPGSDLFILCQEVRKDSRRFVTLAQGVVGRRLAFTTRLTGLLGPAGIRPL